MDVDTRGVWAMLHSQGELLCPCGVLHSVNGARAAVWKPLGPQRFRQEALKARIKRLCPTTEGVAPSEVSRRVEGAGRT